MENIALKLKQIHLNQLLSVVTLNKKWPMQDGKLPVKICDGKNIS